MSGLAKAVLGGAAGIAIAYLRSVLRASPLNDQGRMVGERTPSNRPANGSDQATRAELYEEAQRLDIPGRSRMNKAELQLAIKQEVGNSPSSGSRPSVGSNR